MLGFSVGVTRMVRIGNEYITQLMLSVVETKSEQQGSDASTRAEEASWIYWTKDRTHGAARQEEKRKTTEGVMKEALVDAGGQSELQAL